ncbi:MAG: G5 domain-containing protein [Candidatus Dojkabacteria bacterium]|jgi:hypothetical protein|nr:G5 domain-containing protein [Candidatus Dojkabacteria bacterium]MDD2270359.1 G5 domain-containing protein [Candidatus Dojkabacteria bacterium]
MKNLKLSVLFTVVSIAVMASLMISGLPVSYTEAYENPNLPNVSEIVFNFDSQEVKNIYDLNLVTIIINNVPKKILTNKSDIYRLLSDLGVVVDQNKKIISTTENIQTGSVVRVIAVGSVIEEHNVEIPFSTEEVKTKEIPYGQREIVQEGVLGVRTKQVKKVYEDGKLVSEQILSERVTLMPKNALIKVGILQYSPEDLDKKYGYNCNQWYGVVDGGNYSDQEKQWLKFVMYCESGCNAESNKHPAYKGLFQWSPKSWDILYKKDSIFDGHAQIRNTVDKIRRGVNLYSFWPSCHRQYVATYGEFK